MMSFLIDKVLQQLEFNLNAVLSPSQADDDAYPPTLT